MRSPRFTLRRMMITVAFAAALFAWIHADAQSLIGSIFLAAVLGPVFAGISLDRARGGLGILGGAIGGCLSPSLIFLGFLGCYVIGTGGSDLNPSEVSSVFGLIAGGGAGFGVITGLTAYLLTDRHKAPRPCTPRNHVTPEVCAP
jgi:hypothetical protein